MNSLGLIQTHLTGRVLIVGIGNEMMGDDGAGPELIKRCKGLKLPFDLLDTGETPENFVNTIVNGNYSTILLVDAVFMGKQPGEIKVAAADELFDATASTHNMSMKTYMDYIYQSTKAKVLLVGIQPQTTKFGTSITAEVSKAIDKIIDAVKSKGTKQNRNT